MYFSSSTNDLFRPKKGLKETQKYFFTKTCFSYTFGIISAKKAQKSKDMTKNYIFWHKKGHFWPKKDQKRAKIQF